LALTLLMAGLFVTHAPRNDFTYFSKICHGFQAMEFINRELFL
jgi:hypothetical protein